MDELRLAIWRRSWRRQLLPRFSVHLQRPGAADSAAQSGQGKIKRPGLLSLTHCQKSEIQVLKYESQLFRFGMSIPSPNQNPEVFTYHISSPYPVITVRYPYENREFSEIPCSHPYPVNRFENPHPTKAFKSWFQIIIQIHGHSRVLCSYIYRIWVWIWTLRHRIQIFSSLDYRITHHFRNAWFAFQIWI